MAKKKKIITTVKLQLNAGEAGAGPPVATALGPHGVPPMEFARQYNEKTSNQKGMVVPAVVTIYDDRTFDFVLKTPPAAVLIRQAAGLEKGSAEPNRNKVGTISRQQLREIAETKMVDLNANDLEQAEKIIAGTARSMGVTVQ